MDWVGHAIPVHAIFVQIVGFHTNGGFVHVQAGRQVCIFPSAGKDANEKNNTEEDRGFPTVEEGVERVHADKNIPSLV